MTIKLRRLWNLIYRQSDSHERDAAAADINCRDKLRLKLINNDKRAAPAPAVQKSLADDSE